MARERNTNDTKAEREGRVRGVGSDGGGMPDWRTGRPGEGRRGGGGGWAGRQMRGWEPKATGGGRVLLAVPRCLCPSP